MVLNRGCVCGYGCCDAMCIAAVAKWILINLQTHSKYAYHIMKEKREYITKRVSSKNTFLFHV